MRTAGPRHGCSNTHNMTDSNKKKPQNNPKANLNTYIAKHTSLQMNHSTQYPIIIYSGGKFCCVF